MLQGLFSRHTRLVGAVISALGIAVLSGAPAKAALITTDACDNATLSQPFTQWGDTNEYKLVPGGSFENGAAGWTLSHGASIVHGSEPFGATGSVGASSVYLPAGASVTSPFTCVDAAYPSFRFFARNNGLLSTVLVSVVYRRRFSGSRSPCPSGRWRSPQLGPVAADAHRVGRDGAAPRGNDPDGRSLHGGHRQLADRRRVRRSAHALLIAREHRYTPDPGPRPAHEAGRGPDPCPFRPALTAGAARRRGHPDRRGAPRPR